VLDGGNANVAPKILESINLYGCFVQNADYGELAYGTNEEATVALSIRFDNMEQWGADKTSTSLEGGIGAAVGRQVATQAITGALGTQG
jgi:hypothetical protein